MFLTSPKKTLGLDISELSIKAVQITKKKGKKTIQAIASLNLPKGIIEEGSIKDAKKLAQQIKKIFKIARPKFNTKYAVISLPEPKTFIKTIKLNKQITKNNSLIEAIREELPRHIPVNINEVQIDWQEISANKKERTFMVAAVPKEIAEEYISTCQLADIRVVALEIEAQAIMRSILPLENKSFKYQLVGSPNKTKPSEPKLAWLKKIIEPNFKQASKTKDKNPKMIIDFGATRTGLSLIDKEAIQFTNSLSGICGEKITAKIMEDKNLSYAEAEKAKLICGSDIKKCKGLIVKIINRMIDELAKEIINADEFYQQHFGEQTRDLEIILCGGGANLSGIDEILKKKIKRHITIGDTMQNLDGQVPNKIKNIMSYTTAIGLALRNYS